MTTLTSSTITDRDIANLCSGIYAYPGALPVAWDHFDLGIDDGVCWALKTFLGADVVIMRGSDSLEDWIHDADAIAITTRLGKVHPGFYAGMEKMWSEQKYSEKHMNLRGMLTNDNFAKVENHISHIHWKQQSFSSDSSLIL